MMNVGTMRIINKKIDDDKGEYSNMKNKNSKHENNEENNGLNNLN